MNPGSAGSKSTCICCALWYTSGVLNVSRNLLSRVPQSENVVVGLGIFLKGSWVRHEDSISTRILQKNRTSKMESFFKEL